MDKDIIGFVFESVDSSFICEEFAETIEININDKYMIFDKDGREYKIFIEEI